jgi:hypothetical protein
LGSSTFCFLVFDLSQLDTPFSTNLIYLFPNRRKRRVIFLTGVTFVAKAQAIAVVGQTILGLLADNIPRTDFANALYELYQPSNLNPPMSEGISLFLYRIEINAGMRNIPNRTGLDGITRRAPLPLDLYYLLTVWATDVVKQQRILGLAMQTLADLPVISAGRLNSFGPETDVFRPDETVEVIFNSLSLQDVSNLWSAFKVTLPVSLGYIARVVGIDSAIQDDRTTPVQTREMNFAEK